MSDNILVINLSKTRKPDLWLLSSDTFTDEELAPYKGAMRRRKIRILPHGTPARWGKLYSKAVVLASLSSKK